MDQLVATLTAAPGSGARPAHVVDPCLDGGTTALSAALRGLRFTGGDVERWRSPPVASPASCRGDRPDLASYALIIVNSSADKDSQVSNAGVAALLTCDQLLVLKTIAELPEVDSDGHLPVRLGSVT